MRANTLDAKQLEIDGQGASGGSNPNLFINGQFDVWQRATSVSGPLVSTYSCADRWLFYDGTNGTADVSRQTFTVGQTDVPYDPIYYVEYDMTVQATTGSPGIHQRIEYVTTAAGQELTFSFYAKLASGTLDVNPVVRQDFGSTGSTGVDTEYTSQTITITSSWELHTVTLDIPSISGKTVSGGNDFIMLGFYIPLSSGTFTLSLANMKAEIGSIFTPYQRKNYGEELALCQRYYYRISTTQPVGIASANSTTSMRLARWHPVPMRAIPTVSTTFANFRNYNTSGSPTLTTTYQNSKKGCMIVLGDTGLTTNNAYIIDTQSISGELEFDAEL